MKPFTARFWPRYPAGQDPTIFWVIEERADGWLVERLREPGNDLPVKQLFIKSSEWSKREIKLALENDKDTSTEGWGL